MTVYRIISMILHHVLINFMITDICDMNWKLWNLKKNDPKSLFSCYLRDFLADMIWQFCIFDQPWWPTFLLTQLLTLQCCLKSFAPWLKLLHFYRFEIEKWSFSVIMWVIYHTIPVSNICLLVVYNRILNIVL